VLIDPDALGVLTRSGFVWKEVYHGVDAGLKYGAQVGQVAGMLCAYALLDNVVPKPTDIVTDPLLCLVAGVLSGGGAGGIVGGAWGLAKGIHVAVQAESDYFVLTYA